MTDIVERLRTQARRETDEPDPPALMEAADEIERLRAERDEWRQCAQVEGDLHSEARIEIERLTEQCKGLAQAALNNGQELLLKEAEIERLRAVIQQVIDLMGNANSEDHFAPYGDIMDVLEAAIGKGKQL